MGRKSTNGYGEGVLRVLYALDALRAVARPTAV
jgi:hypothetical protein